MPSEKAAPASNVLWKSTLATAYISCSIAMFLTNKLGIVTFPFTFTLIYFQNVTTLVILLLKWMRAPDQAVTWSWSFVRAWIPVIVVFLMILGSSLQALRLVPPSTVIVFRNLNAISVLLVDRYFLHRQSNNFTRELISLCVIAVGATLYGYADLSFHGVGYLWAFVNVGSMGVYSLLLKYLQQNNAAVKATNATQLSFYNNLLSVLVLPLCAYLNSEIAPATAMLSQWVEAGEWQSLSLLLFSCILGFGISLSSFYVSANFSSTAYVVMNNLNKIPVILIGQLLFPSPQSVEATVGLGISLVGGLWFALENMKK